MRKTQTWIDQKDVAPGTNNHLLQHFFPIETIVVQQCNSKPCVHSEQEKQLQHEKDKLSAKQILAVFFCSYWHQICLADSNVLLASSA
jgi:hypothetical protein